LKYLDLKIVKRKFQPNPEKIMESLKNREFYLHRRAEQLRQWERVIDKLIVRADKASDKSRKELRRHIARIKVKKASTEVKLKHLQEEGNGNWDALKADLELNWVELRKAFLRASAKPK
jgi:hypothetical protein